MATLEMVEKLRQHANVSYDEAKSALEACGDDLLEAMIYLEKQGKVNPPESGGFYSSTQDQKAQNAAHISVVNTGKGNSETFGSLMRRFWNWLRGVIHKGNTNHFEVWHGGSCSLSVPVTVLVLLTVFCFWIVVPLLIIGLFFGCNYRFRGPELNDTKVNNVMDSAAKAADTFKNEVIFPDGKQKDQKDE